MTMYMGSKDVQFQFMKFPKYLLSSGLNETCQILYVLLLDRARLSLKNGWIDDDDHVFIYYPIRKLAEDMGKGQTTIKDSLKILEAHDLIRRRPQGAPKPTRIYVKIPEEALLETTSSADIPAYQKTGSRPIKGRNSGYEQAGFPATSKNKRTRVMEPEYVNYDYGGNTL